MCPMIVPSQILPERLHNTTNHLQSQSTLGAITPHVVPPPQKSRIPLTLAPPAIMLMYHINIQRSQWDLLLTWASFFQVTELKRQNKFKWDIGVAALDFEKVGVLFCNDLLFARHVFDEMPE
ncbi:hypothetical protein PIB30_004331 [Stylosanthes scabra]|uniref:Uncharacterized protein n=1 Tax=Stylosanthes scabra TaxID=79078 RepID=A0ABU6T3Z4_9FABA|nr:hypothetical protein [Stylosanthes scabra]